MEEVRALVSSFESHFYLFRLDSDGSGFLEMEEVRSLVSSFYSAESGAPPYEADALMRLLDANRDGRVSWPEFSAALGARKDNLPDFGLKVPTHQSIYVYLNISLFVSLMAGVLGGAGSQEGQPARLWAQGSYLSIYIYIYLYLYLSMYINLSINL